jgi:Flp pilus assembly protein TadG
MKENQKTDKRTQSGQSLVELALSLIVILFLLLGAVEFGIALFQFVTIRDAAQEGAVYGSINPADENGMKQRAIATAADVVPLTTGDITITINNMTVAQAISNNKACEGVTGGLPHTITITITYNHVIFMPLVSAMLSVNNIPLTANVTNTILSPFCE